MSHTRSGGEGAKVWVTRASPGAQATAERLRALGFAPVVAPLLEIRPIPGGPIDLTGVAALAFTSANGVAAFAARCATRDLPAFAVGAATAEVARAAGFAQVVSAEGDVEALAPVIAAHGPFAGVVLHPGPAEPAGDLVAALEARGVRATRLAVYETVTLAADPAIDAPGPDAGLVLLHSPKAARALATRLAGRPAGGLTALCLSANVAAPLAGVGLAAVRVAAAPTEAALLDLLSPALSDDGAPPGAVLSRAFWVMMVLAAICMAAGLTIAVFGPRLFPVHAAALGDGGKAR